MKTLIIAAAASLIAIAAPAAAETSTVSVAYGDLDLSTPAGTHELAQRIDASAKEVCGRADVRDLKAAAAVSVCRETAVAGAVEQLKTAGVEAPLAI